MKKVNDLIYNMADIGIAFLLVFLSLPVSIFAAFLVKLDSPGPVFYLQERFGKNKKKFLMYKFRTMKVNSENSVPVWGQENDPRSSRIGKLLRVSHIDELPQLWNVLKGDMSLVGPRPPLPEEVEQYTPAQRRRLSMRPGITCVWQIEGRSKIFDFEEWSRLDLEYIDNWSFWLDFKILIKSIPVVLFGKGAV